MELRNLFCVDTPFQLYNSALIAEKELENGVKSDIVIFDNFRNAQQISQRVKKAGVFARLWVLPAFTIKAKKRIGTSEIISLTFKSNDAINYIQKYITSSKDEYSRYYCSIFTGQTLLVHAAIAPGTPTTLFEDGSGTYNGAVGQMVTAVDGILNLNSIMGKPNVLRLMAKRATAITFTLASLGKYRLGVDSLLLWSPSDNIRRIYKKKITIRSLPKASVEFSKTINSALLGNNVSLYQNAKAIFFLSPYISDSLSQLERIAIEEAARYYGSSLVVRPHPRAKLPSESISPAILDDGQTSWEVLVASGALSEDTVLMGVGSSALMAPKRLLGKEPPLIYICNIMKYDKNTKQQFCQEARIAREEYINHSRVHLPDSIADLSNQLLSFRHNKEYD